MNILRQSVTRIHRPILCNPSRIATTTNITRHYSPLPRTARGRKGFTYPSQTQGTPIRGTNDQVDTGSGSNPSYEGYSFDSYSGTVPNPGGLLRETDGIARILNEPTIVIERQIEMMNMFLGFEQANQYVIMDALGNRIGYMSERDFGIGKMIMRQITRLHRPFVVDVFDNAGNPLMTIKRPFSFINSHIKAILPGFANEEEGVIGESVQSWHLWRRRYNLFKANSHTEFDQFGAIDSGFLAFDFPVRDESGRVIGAVDRNWVGLGRELFTDTGVYIVRMDPASFAGMGDLYPKVAGPLTLDQRAVLLANAVSVDFDYFSRHSNRGGLISFGDYE